MLRIFIISNFLFAPYAFAGFKFEYSNDFFTGTDQYFSQGIELDYKSDSLKKILPDTPLLIKKEKILRTEFSISLDYFGFTPKDAYPPEIQLGDRPFANVMLFSGSTDSLLKKSMIQISSTYKIGAIGRLTGGEFVHKSIHKATGNKLPRGWDNQIKNDLLLSFEVHLIKHFSFFKNYLQLQGGVELELGSWRIRQAIAAKIKMGFLEEIMSIKKASSAYVFLSPSLTRVYFDASLQGGILSRNSPYKLSSKEVKDYASTLETGIHLGIKSFAIEYSQVWMSREFNSGEKHSYGKLSLLFNF